MFNVVLVLHNLVRWVVIILAVLVLVRAYRGWLGNRAWENRDRQVGVFFTSALDTQMLLGLLLIVLLGVTNLGSYLIEHVVPMFVAILIAHAGNALSKKASGDQAMHRMAALIYSLSVLIILVAIPWNHPLFPGLGGL